MEHDEKDGWNLEDFDELNDVFDEFDGLEYEVRNCIRGCNTGCKTYKELGNYISDIVEKLNDVAHQLKYKTK